MSHFDYEASKRISMLDAPFCALIMTAYRQADSENAAKLRASWPDVIAELDARYNAPGGVLPGEAARCWCGRPIGDPDAVECAEHDDPARVV